ncbi:TSUP family transporter [Pseudomonas syringae]|uniref:sulfite exporter TauE/SafE family protein n=1 Tax=Pseudomonas syringae TaxID=317 RepID=UPI001F3650EC|nr:sulfite exporter TauE/SafE family protein [Pseudomonas syringae]MCF5706946.1 TSUP family transporter [Pseudomonas syringae]
MNALFDIPQTLGIGLIALVFGTFLLAGAVKGVIGLGLPTVSMGLLGLAMLPAQAAALLIVPSIVTNFWQLATGGHLGLLSRRLGPMLAMVFIGTCAGSYWLGMNSGHSMTRALGGALLLYALSGLFLPAFTVASNTERWLGPVCGFITGIVTSATGVFVIPAVPYLQALGLERHQLVQALGLSFTVSTLALAIGLSSTGALGRFELGASLLALIPALLGMLLGQWLRARISAVVFKRTFFIGMALLGLHLLMKG